MWLIEWLLTFAAGAMAYAIWWHGSHVGICVSVPFDLNRALGMSLF